MNLAELVPHRGRMLLLDGVESYDAARGVLRAWFTVREDNVFFDGHLGGLPSWTAIELMAQAAAACAGAHDLAKSPGVPPKPGLLLGSRKVLMPLAVYPLGARFDVVAEAEFHDEESGAFSCEIRDARGGLAASCVLTAYRPPDFIGFLRGAARAPQ